MIKLAQVKLVDTIPPSIATDARMRAIADAVDVELNKQPGLVRTILLWAQIDTLPSGVLDHLAEQFSVPVWRDSWPQATKVSVLKTAIRDKSVVGTRGAVERAVMSLGSAVEIVEWFEDTPIQDPYTFQVIIDVNEIPGQATIDTQRDLAAAIDAAKPARSHYRILLTLKLSGAVGLYGAVRGMTVARLKMVADEPFDPLTLGPLIWLDSADVATIFVDAAGTVPVVADGDPVGRWVNKGTLGAAGDAVQTVSANRPIFRGGGG